LSDTSEEEAMPHPQQTKRRGITKKRKVVDASPKQKTRGSLHKNTIGQLRCHQDDDESSYQDSNASDIEDESNNEDVEDDDESS
jgi:hypothetical protein